MDIKEKIRKAKKYVKDHSGEYHHQSDCLEDAATMYAESYEDYSAIMDALEG